MSQFRGLEAINFIGGSTLAKSLTAVFQAGMDFRDKLKLTDIDAKTQRISKMLNYVEDTLIPNFIKTIKNEVNLEVVKVVAYDDQPNGMFAVMISFDNIADAQDLMSQQSGGSSAPTKFRSSLKEMMTLNEHFDTKTSKLTSTTFGKKNNRKIKCHMYMDVMSAFLLHDFVGIETVELLTAEELAAIYIHEIGHVLTVVERSAHTYLTIHRNTDHLVASLKNTDIKTVVTDLLEVGIPELTKLADANKIDNKTVTTITSTLKNITYILDKEEGRLSSAVIEFILRVLISILIIMVTIWHTFSMGIFMQNLITGMLSEFTFAGSNKSSDVLDTKHNFYQIERMADEFVSRHGMGSYDASALNKIHIAFVLMGIGLTTNSVILRRSSKWNNYLKLMVNTIMLLQSVLIPFPGYESQVNRAARLIQNANALFKNDVKGDLLKYYLDDLKRLETELQKARKFTHADISEILHKYLMSWANPAALIAIVTTGRIAKEYEAQQNMIEDLVNNHLYATSAKFKHLAEKSKR